MVQDVGCVRILAAGKARLGWGLLFVLHMEEERGITAGEIFRLIKNRIFWILAVSAFAALAAALFTSLVYNRAREEFYLSFVIDLPQEAAFRYETIVFADNLEAAKLSDASFSAIDTDRMATNEDIHISRMGEEDQLPSYRVSVKGKYFSNRDQATNFLRAMVSHAVSQVPVTLQKRTLYLFPTGAQMNIVEANATDGIVRYRQNTVSVTDNKKSPLFASFAGFLMAFLVSSVVFCILDYNAKGAGHSDHFSAVLSGVSKEPSESVEKSLVSSEKEHHFEEKQTALYEEENAEEKSSAAIEGENQNEEKRTGKKTEKSTRSFRKGRSS